MKPDDVIGRLFVGVALSADVKAALAAHLAPVSPLPGRPGPPDNWHVTLRFLGDTTRVQLDRLLEGLSGLPAAGRLRLGGLGAFPRPQRATVLWIGVGPGLDGLAAAAEDAAVDAGFRSEERPFHAHVTLSRLRPPQNVTSLIETTAPLGIKMPVTELTVFRSQLGSGGATYEAIDTVPLR